MWTVENYLKKFILLNSALSTNFVGLLSLIATYPSGLVGFPFMELSNFGLADNALTNWSLAACNGDAYQKFY